MAAGGPRPRFRRLSPPPRVGVPEGVVRRRFPNLLPPRHWET